MPKKETTEFWKGSFGQDYITRNSAGWQRKMALFSKVFSSCDEKVDSILELGSNIGLNIKALRCMLPSCSYSAVELNQNALDILSKDMPDVEAYCSPVQEFSSDKVWDFVFTKGLLIHIHPDDLAVTYDKIYSLSSKYIFIAESYNPTPVEVNYRGNSEKLFKRDFAGEMLDRFEDLRLVNYGFVYHRDLYFAQDDDTWFLLKKTK